MIKWATLILPFPNSHLLEFIGFVKARRKKGGGGKLTKMSSVKALLSRHL